MWDHLDRAPDAHELTCPFCQAARSDLANLNQATQQLRQDEAEAELKPSPDVLERVLAVARAEVRRGRRLPLDQPSPDQTSPNTVSEQTVTAVIRRIGDRTRQIQVRRCTITADQANPSASTSSSHQAGTQVVGASALDPAGPGPALVAVSLRVSVGHDLAIGQVTHQLRTAVIGGIAQEVGLNVVTVDIVVEDLHDA